MANKIQVFSIVIYVVSVIVFCLLLCRESLYY